MSRLYFIQESDTSGSFALKDDVTYVGRSPRNDIQIKDSSISRKHFRILKRNNKDKIYNNFFILSPLY